MMIVTIVAILEEISNIFKTPPVVVVFTLTEHFIMNTILIIHDFGRIPQTHSHTHAPILPFYHIRCCILLKLYSKI